MIGDNARVRQYRTDEIIDLFEEVAVERANHLYDSNYDHYYTSRNYHYFRDEVERRLNEWAEWKKERNNEAASSV